MKFPNTSTSFRIVTAMLAGGMIVSALSTMTTASAAPAVALIGQVGEPAPGGRVHVMLLLKSIDGAVVGDTHAIYHKQGASSAAGPYSLLGVVRPTTDVVGLGAILQEAREAGYDLSKLAAALPGDGSLELRLARALLAVSVDGSADERRELLAATQLPAAMAMGRAYIARVSAASISTFEVRRYDPITASDGKVAGRVTTGTAPDFLPAPTHLTERSGDAPRDHFRASMIWTQPEALRRKMLHWQGFNIYCAERQAWRDEFGGDPPASITRARLLDALASGFAVQVNDLPVLPDVDVGFPIPADAIPYFTHDYAQGEEPEDGAQFMYWVCAGDYFCRPGHPSEGIMITFCDRKPPSVPAKLRASRAHTYKEDGTGGSFIQLQWQGAPVEEVARYYVYASIKHDAGMEDMANDELDPLTANLIATVENTGEAQMRFPADSDPIVQLQLAPGETWHFWLRCEDNAVCKKNGFSNLSGVTASAPAFLPIIRVAGRPSGRIVVTCCELGGDPGSDVLVETTGAIDGRVTLKALRPGLRIGSVEFREMTNNLSFGTHFFEPGATELEVDAEIAGLEGNVELGARFFTTAGKPMKFRLPGGSLQEWLSLEFNAAVLDNLILTWRSSLDCRTVPLSLCPDPIDPFDPETGELLPVCIEFQATADAKSWHAYKRNGLTGILSKFAGGGFDEGGAAVAKDANFPARGGLICYFLQFFDEDGNASAIVPVGCVQRAAKVPLPRPSISGSERVGESDQDVSAFSPRQGVERLEWKICPAPVGATNTVTEAFLDDGVLKFVNCALIDGPRLEADYGGDTAQFVQRFALSKGVSYRVRVRAVGAGTIDEREFGLWSEEHIINWEIEPPLNGPKVPWPAREVPGVAAGLARAIFDSERQLICVRIGTIPRDAGVVVPTGTGGFAVIPGSSIEAYLDDSRDFVIYLRPEGATASGKELQVSHYVQKFLTSASGPDQILISDKSIVVKPDPADILVPGGAMQYHIWMLIPQPVIQGRTYSCSIVRHGDDREPVETIRSNVVTIPSE